MSNQAAIAGTSFTQAGISLGGGIGQAFALQQQGSIAQRFAELNAKAAELRARDAIRRGEKAVAKFRKSSKILLGRQRAALAAQGIDVSTGTAAQIQEETARMTTEDVIEIRNNAWREAFGFRFEAISLRGQGSFSRLEAQSRAGASLLTGGLGALSAIQQGRAVGAFERGFRFESQPGFREGFFGPGF